MSILSENLEKIKQEIAPYTPKIIAVTKYFDETAIIEGYEAGLRDFGENRVLDAIEKIDKLPSEIKENSNFHLIGHLQTNKVRKAVGVFDYIHSVDSVKLAKAIGETATEKDVVQKILLQINNANEESKYGFGKNEVVESFGEIVAIEGLNVVGLMTIAPLSDDEAFLQGLFKEIIQIKDIILNKYGYNLSEISMGMSNDYKIAVQEGSTCIRVGRKLFFK